MSVEVKPGYKLTEVGVIPEDWSCERLGSAAANRPNAIVGGPFGSDLVSADYVSYGIPVIRGQNMAGSTVAGEFAFVSPENARKLRANLAQPGDLVFTQRGTLGQVAIVPDDTFEAFLVSQSQMKVSLNRERHDPVFLRQYFASQFGQKQILDSAIQTGVPHTNLGILRAYCFPAPLLREQQAIATVLSDVDAVLGGLDRLIAKKRNLKQAAMQQLLTGQTRLPGFQGEWEVRKLSEHFKIYAGGDVPKHSLSQTQSASYPYPIFANAIKDKGLYGYTNECRSKADSLTITARGYLGHAEYRDEPFFPIVRLLVLEPIGQLDARFTSYAVNDRIEFAIESTGVPQLTAPQVGKYSVTAPPSLPEQTAIAAVLSDMNAELAALEARRDKTRALKQAMMQELLTGRTRLVSRGDAKNAEERE